MVFNPNDLNYVSDSYLQSPTSESFPPIISPKHTSHHSFLKQMLDFDSEEDQKSPGSKSSFRNLFLRSFKQLEFGQIELKAGDKSYLLGKKNNHQTNILAEVHNPRFFRKVVLGGSIGAAESYMAGDWSCSDLSAAIQIIISNMDRMTKIDRSSAFLQYLSDLVFHKLRFNSIGNSKKNISSHYDLGNEFYQLFLDPTLNYSSGIFPNDNSSMEEASKNKMMIIGRRLQLQPSDHVVEIGTGWGSLAIFLAKEFGCRVTTTTISEEQYRHVKQRIQAEGLTKKIDLLRKDYRQLPSTCGEAVFDKLVSVEMIEAVGHQYYDSFFDVCQRLTKPGGKMLLQAITIGDQHYKSHIRGVDFISRYIFPGGSLPSVGAICQSVGKKTQFRLVHLDDFTSHYERTLIKWRDKFFTNITQIKQLGYSASFLRMWHYYLCYCEAAFASERVHSVQVLFSKPNQSLGS